ncbi:methyl-accepting chemotaxis protein [Vibrio gazogenes]|uniref:Methyl-accepting chemotaxis protein n=1 Tax=Vibrio gazogenes DSM 21264 = NBRC 103151 TaxID=1123492 RepID=A0A1M5DE51_VIBGA|nr:methyl-accepting chemotaxis protein [Vibrio gazogenes]USP14537.1 methyl-accepting chemotaxis protein [Vibrio gazogenes]SHF65206.1 methyl-accepting chemotaxis protein [Vibrio gazogenes DSM 21264] [Vibrio gazogenes DSM 21264 = NBRC 103151]SJN55956.1 Methyl-accepting chemotaxis protein PctC [Vibrio gazogenes]
MKQLGLKKLLILSVMLLVGISVSITSYVLYSQEEKILTENVFQSSENYVASKAVVIETILQEKINGIHRLAQQYQHQEITRSEDELIPLTQSLAAAMNLDSFVIGLDDGRAYWSMENQSWPNHRLKGDARDTDWYKQGQASGSVSITPPYLGSSKQKYWVSILEKIKDGVITTDMELDFLSQIVKESNKIPGAVALILDEDSRILATTSPALKLGDDLRDTQWGRPLAQHMVEHEFSHLGYALNGTDKLMFSHRIHLGQKNWYYMIGLDKSVVFKQLTEARNSAILFSFLACLVSVILTYFLIQVLYRPILSLKETIQGLASGEGDLTQRLKVETNDDLGQISQGVNQFIENLQHMMLEIQKYCHSLQANVEHMLGQSEKNSSILQKHVSETEQVVTAIEEMSSTADSMATDAANTASLVARTNETSMESREIIDRSKETVSALIDDVEHSVSDVHNMTLETQKINEILSVIGEIAEQTNLLALNAAIEAARAGEQGRGFAVVADEVRSLASRTKDSTTEVEQALKSLANGNHAVVNSMEHTRTRCQETADGAGQAADSLEVISQHVMDINDLSSQIATAAEEQSCVTQELSRNMSAINDMVVELESIGVQSMSDMGDIADINNSLTAIVSRFKL